MTRSDREGHGSDSACRYGSVQHPGPSPFYLPLSCRDPRLGLVQYVLRSRFVLAGNPLHFGPHVRRMVHVRSLHVAPQSCISCNTPTQARTERHSERCVTRPPRRCSDLPPPITWIRVQLIGGGSKESLTVASTVQRPLGLAHNLILTSARLQWERLRISRVRA